MILHFLQLLAAAGCCWLVVGQRIGNFLLVFILAWNIHIANEREQHSRCDYRFLANTIRGLECGLREAKQNTIDWFSRIHHTHRRNSAKNQLHWATLFRVFSDIAQERRRNISAERQDEHNSFLHWIVNFVCIRYSYTCWKILQKTLGEFLRNQLAKIIRIPNIENSGYASDFLFITIFT